MERNARVVWLGEVGVTLYPKINVIGLCGSELNGVQVDHIFLKANCSFEYNSSVQLYATYT